MINSMNTTTFKYFQFKYAELIDPR